MRIQPKIGLILILILLGSNARGISRCRKFLITFGGLIATSLVGLEIYDRNEDGWLKGIESVQTTYSPNKIFQDDKKFEEGFKNYKKGEVFFKSSKFAGESACGPCAATSGLLGAAEKDFPELLTKEANFSYEESLLYCLNCKMRWQDGTAHDDFKSALLNYVKERGLTQSGIEHHAWSPSSSREFYTKESSIEIMQKALKKEKSIVYLAWQPVVRQDAKVSYGGGTGHYVVLTGIIREKNFGPDRLYVEIQNPASEKGKERMEVDLTTDGRVLLDNRCVIKDVITLTLKK